MYTNWCLEDYESEIGSVKANLELIKNISEINIFKDTKTYEIVAIGEKNYQELNNFIKDSMNDLYEQLKTGTKQEIINKRNDYKQLYKIWQDIEKRKKENDPLVDELYNDLIFALHALGYNKNN